MKNLKKYKFGIAIIGLIIFFTACEKDQLLDQLYQNGAGQSYSDNDLISIINDLSISADEKEDLLFESIPLTDAVLIAFVRSGSIFDDAYTLDLLTISFPISENLGLSILASKLSDEIKGEIGDMNGWYFDIQKSMAAEGEECYYHPMNHEIFIDHIGEVHSAGLDEYIEYESDILVFDANGDVDEDLTSESTYNFLVSFMAEEIPCLDGITAEPIPFVVGPIPGQGMGYICDTPMTATTLTAIVEQVTQDVNEDKYKSVDKDLMAEIKAIYGNEEGKRMEKILQF